MRCRATWILMIIYHLDLMLLALMPYRLPSHVGWNSVSTVMNCSRYKSYLSGTCVSTCQFWNTLSILVPCIEQCGIVLSVLQDFLCTCIVLQRIVLVSDSASSFRWGINFGWTIYPWVAIKIALAGLAWITCTTSDPFVVLCGDHVYW